LSPRLIAALLTRMSIPPHFSTSSRVNFFIPTRSTTETFALKALRPWASIF
jgi:hypothetical protein